MAAAPADAFCRGFSCYDQELISAAADNLWSSNVVATASTGASWVDDVDVGISAQHQHIINQSPYIHLIQQNGPIQNITQRPLDLDSLDKRIQELRRQFHRGRQLQVKHLPRECTEEELREVLGKWDIQSLGIQAGSARVALTSPEVLEDWDRNLMFTIRGQRVTIVPSPTEMLLCVGRLPLSHTEQQFTALVAAYGEVKRSFLMISERTGESKGYGFVEYVTKEAALQAKNALDGRQIQESTAVCDWLDSSHITLRSLHSKCLYVDQLPANYRNMGEFRRIFSTVVNPPYCQIALKNGCPQDWGLVEFLGEDEAEKTQQSLNGYILHGRRIRIAYYIPGVRAINLYLKLLNDGGNSKGRSALLPDPPAPAVFQQLQNLAKQNPVFAQNLQSIILQQIQDAQKGKRVQGDPQQSLRGQFQKGHFSNNFNNNNTNALKSAHQTLTLLLATQQMQQNGGGPESPNNDRLSPNSTAQAQSQQQLLSALQAVTKGDLNFLNGIPGLNNGSNAALTSLLGLASPNGSSDGMSLGPGMTSPRTDNPASSSGLTKSMSSSSIPHGFMPSPMMFPGGMSNLHLNNVGIQKSATEDHWSNFGNKPNRMNTFGSGGGGNGFHKNPLLPNPTSNSPMLDIPMETNAPKTPPNDPFQAVWYSLFGHSSPPDTGPNTPGNTSPLFMKGSLSSNSSVGSPIGRSGNESIFGIPNHHLHSKSSPPGFSTPNGHHNPGRGNTAGELQEAVNSIVNNPHGISHLFGSNGGGSLGTGTNGGLSPPPFLLQNNHQRSNSYTDLQGSGMSNAILDLLMQSMKNDQYGLGVTLGGGQESFGGNGGGGNRHHHQHHQSQQNPTSWSSGLSSPPSPIGNNRHYVGNNGHCPSLPPQRSGSNGSSEMRSSSPRSPTYSPFSRNSTNNKSLLESGNGNVSPTSTPWNNSALGSPPHSHSGFGNSTVTNNGFGNRIWAAPSISPGNGNNNHHLLNPLGQKRKVHHESMASEGEFVTTSSPPTPSPTNPNHLHQNGLSSSLTSHYADSYFKKKKKN